MITDFNRAVIKLVCGACPCASVEGRTDTVPGVGVGDYVAADASGSSKTLF